MEQRSPRRRQMRKNRSLRISIMSIIMCVAFFTPSAATDYNGTQVESGEVSTETAIPDEDYHTAALEAMKTLSASLAAEVPTAIFDAAARTITAVKSSNDSKRETKRTYITSIDVSVFDTEKPLDIILPHEDDSLIINVTGMEDGHQYFFMSDLKFSGKDVPVDNGRTQASRVLLNLGTYADGDTGFLDFGRIDGVTLLAPLATIKYPMGRVETVVMVGTTGLLYSVEVEKGSTHAAIQLETDVMASRDFTLTPTMAEEPAGSTQLAESQQPAESSQPTESQPPAESTQPSEPQQPVESPQPSESRPSPKPTTTSMLSPAPKPSGSPAPSADQIAAPSVNPSTPAEVTPPIADNMPQPSESNGPNHVAYVPNSTVDLVNGNEQGKTNASLELSEAEPSAVLTESAQEQDPERGAEQNHALVAFLKVAAILMAVIVVLIIVVLFLRMRTDEKDDRSL